MTPKQTQNVAIGLTRERRQQQVKKWRNDTENSVSDFYRYTGEEVVRMMNEGGKTSQLIYELTDLVATAIAMIERFAERFRRKPYN